MTKDTKYTQAVAKARGEVTPAELIHDLANRAVGVEKVDGGTLVDIQEMLSSGDFEMAPQLLTLQTGDKIFGVLTSVGTTLLDSLQTPGAKDRILTYQFRLRDGAMVSILGASQIDRDLGGSWHQSSNGDIVATATKIGHSIMIAKGGKTTTRKGRQIGEYLILVSAAPAKLLSPATAESLMEKAK
jgi:hypothetical protein